MSKPIVITKLKGGWALHVNGKPLVKDGGKFKLSETADATPGVIETLNKAEGFAHQIGRYKLGLGDFVFSYTEIIK